MKLLTKIIGATALLGALLPSAFASEHDCGGVVLTTPDPSKFSIELDGDAPTIVGNIYTYKYIVKKLTTGGNENPDLSHFLVALGQIDCFVGENDIDDLVVGGRLNGNTILVQTRRDGSTGYYGMKIDLPGGIPQGLEDEMCFEFDLDADAVGGSLGLDCIPALIKAGQQVNLATILGPTCGGDNPPSTTVTVFKYYDLNANGEFNGGNDGDTAIGGWARITIKILDNEENPVLGYDGESYVTMNGFGTFQINLAGVDPELFPLTYEIVEDVPTGWMVLEGADGYTGTITLGQTKTFDFGNVQLGGGGGHTIGFWGNKNGERVFNPWTGLTGPLNQLDALNLKTVSGANQPDFSTYRDFERWLKNSSATNMGYMLSVQLAAMTLNVRATFVNGNALIHAPGTTSANSSGFATVNAVMAEANGALGINATRDYLEALKNALDNANNNLNFVQNP
jgi:hypothetical protein